MLISMLKHIKIHKSTPTYFDLNRSSSRSSTSLKLLNYLKNTEFKILKINPGVMAVIHVAGVRGDPCGAVCSTQYKYCLWLPDDGFLVNRNSLEHLPCLKCLNNSTFLTLCALVGK